MSRRSFIFQNSSYLNKNFNYIKGTIREYDMKAAGLSIIKSKKLLPEEKIKELEKMPKFERNVKIGLLRKKDKALSLGMIKGFKEYREKLFVANDIEDKDIISVHNDAVITINKGLENTKFDNVEFVEKNRYTSYFYINKAEFYFNSRTKQLDVKNISDENLKYHKKYMLKFLQDIFYLIEMGNNKEAILFIRKFADKYRKRKLPMEYYRELNATNQYRFKDIKFLSSRFYLNYEGLSLDLIDITYNYTAYIVNIAKLVYK